MIIRSSVLALLLPLACSGEELLLVSEVADQWFFFINGYGDGKCFNGIDLDHPFQAVDNRCTTIESVRFHDALDEFQACSGFDLNELIETIGSVFLGIGLNCGAYGMGLAKSMDDMDIATMDDVERWKQQDSLFPRVNPDCVDALVGDNPFAHFLLSVEDFPTREAKCFSDLSKRLPSCTLSEWPIPIVGSWIKIMLCAVSSLDQDEVAVECEENLEELSKCFPETDSITESSCKDIRNKCVFGESFIHPPLPMIMPPPFWAKPMGQQCKDHLSEGDASRYMSLLDRYETYRNVCIPAADRAIFDNFKGNGRGGASGFLESASDEMRLTATKTTGSSSKFAPGFFVGLIIAFSAMFGLQKLKSSKKGADPAFNMDYAFHSLELTESLR